MAKYLLACSCGESLAVEPSHCGEELPCPHCGRLVPVPSLRELRSCPLAEDPSENKSVGHAASPASGNGVLLLAIAAIVTGLAFLALVFLVIVRWRTISPVTAADDIYYSGIQIDEMSPETTWQLWSEYGTTGLGDQQLPPYALDQRRLQVVNVLMLISGIVAVGGLALILTLVWRRRPPPAAA